MALTDLFNPAVAYNNPTANVPSGASQVTSSLDQILNPNSSYIQNARQRGIEQAGARGGVNSSIAAGAAERSAMEAAQPLVSQATGLDQANREAQYNQWLSQQNFGQNLFGQAFQTNLDTTSAVNAAALADPELYTPDVVSGLTNFFGNNLQEMFKQYFGT